MKSLHLALLTCFTLSSSAAPMEADLSIFGATSEKLDPVKKDQYSITVLRFHFQWSDHEIKQVGHMQKSFAELIEALGGVLTNPVPTDPSKAMTAGGSAQALVQNHSLYDFS